MKEKTKLNVHKPNAQIVYQYTDFFIAEYSVCNLRCLNLNQYLLVASYFHK